MILGRLLLLPVLTGVLVLPAACRGGDSSGDTKAASGAGAAGPDPSRLTVIAGDLFLKPKEATAAAGPVRVTYVNEGQIMHTLLVQGNKDLKLTVEEKGEEDTGRVELQPGDYTLYCDVAGHRAAGMEMELHVQ